MAKKNVATVSVNVSEVTQIKRGAGRPPKFTGELENRIVSLLRENNATATMAILSAKNGKEKSIGKAEYAKKQKRVSAGFDTALKITMPTLLKLARRNGIALFRGRPRPVVAATVTTQTEPVVSDPVVATNPVTTTEPAAV